MEERRIVSVLCIVVILVLQISSTSVVAWDYAAALSNSILFYEAQRSGKLPGNQRAKWRGDSGLQDGKAQGIDLVGGYHDAGDNVKFGFSMAFTITMLSWSAIEYRSQLEIPGQLGYALEAIKWGTDYFIKAHPEPNVLWGEVGDGYSDHQCWERPEDMTTSRKAYKIDVNNPGSDLAGETAAAMAAASIVFKNTDPAYSSLLVTHAKELFTFANNYRGKYDNSIRIAESFYASASGYDDELLWAAIWLYEATADPYYLNYLVSNAATLGGTSTGMKEFSWDVKYVGVQVLASKILLQGRGGSYTDTLKSYQSKAEYFLCSCLQKNNGDNVQRTPGGLLFVRPWNNVQYVGTAAFILTVYSDYLTSSSQQLQCPGNRVVPSELLSLAQSQIDYILGNNPRATSYMVGFGKTYPQHVHHRASSIVSIKVDSTFVSCLGGFSEWFNRWQSNPNVLVGAIVGGPDQNDDFADQRTNYDQTEPVSCNNAPIIGVLARLHGGYSSPKTPAGPPTTTSVSTPVPHLPGIPHWHPPIHRSVIVIKQEAVASWKYQGRTFYRYAVTLTNVSGRTLTNVILNIQQLYGPAWGITKIGKTSTYTLPEWLRLLHPLQRVNFVYIQAAAAAQIRVASYVVA